MYELRTHSLRKYFKTNLVAAGVAESHADYFMGHVTDTYNQVQSLGVEKLRRIYDNAALSIRPRTRINRIEVLKEIIRAEGFNPEKVLNMEAFADGATTRLGEDPDYERLRILQRTLRDIIHGQASTV